MTTLTIEDTNSYAPDDDDSCLALLSQITVDDVTNGDWPIIERMREIIKAPDDENISFAEGEVLSMYELPLNYPGKIGMQLNAVIVYLHKILQFTHETNEGFSEDLLYDAEDLARHINNALLDIRDD
jgi:hypothetical protein